MANQDGLDACKEAFVEGVANCNRVLIAALAVAKSDADRQAAIDAFKRGIQLCEEARKICDQAFS